MPIPPNMMEEDTEFPAATDGMDAAPAPMAENEVCVDLAALSMPDEKDQLEPPGPGEKVQMMIEGTVSRVVGQKAYVTQEAVNGQPVQAQEGPPTEEQEMTELRGLAKQGY